VYAATIIPSESLIIKQHSAMQKKPDDAINNESDGSDLDQEKVRLRKLSQCGVWRTLLQKYVGNEDFDDEVDEDDKDRQDRYWAEFNSMSNEDFASRYYAGFDRTTPDDDSNSSDSSDDSDDSSDDDT